MFRIAATGVCKRVAGYFACEVGEEVGYHIGREKSISGKTNIKFVTEGILLNELEADKKLSKYSVILIDEAHERHNNTDLLLGLLRDIIQSRKDLKVVIMSASIEVTKFSMFFDMCACN